jgi:monovalent cation/proton antiporter MnhG/PhaG subunit
VTPRDLIVDVLLTFGVGCALVCCFGVLIMRNAFDRLHYSTAATTLPTLLVGAAVLVRESVSAGGLETIAAVALLFLLNPVVQIATARAAQRVEEREK